MIWKYPTIEARFGDEILSPGIKAVSGERLKALGRPHWQGVQAALRKLPLGEELRQRNGCLDVRLDTEVVSIGRAEDLGQEEQVALAEVIRGLIPWRKGPFELFGQSIDAEWRSDKKWSRLVPHLPTLAGKRIADIGCNNGYYMWRMLGEALKLGEPPECIIGMDPSESFYFAFQLVQSFLQRRELSYELLGVEQIEFFPKFFDVVFCLGIVYHQRDPLTMLQNIRSAMRPGGTLILESQGIPGDAPVALFAPDRYAKARNTYFIPTAACMCAWLERAGWTNVAVISDVSVTVEEQRQTELAPYESLADFLHPQDASRTLENFPAPRRVCVMAEAN